MNEQRAQVLHDRIVTREREAAEAQTKARSFAEKAARNVDSAQSISLHPGLAQAYATLALYWQGEAVRLGA